MTPIQYLTTALMALPERARLMLYGTGATVGVILAVLGFLDVHAVLGIALAKWVQAYAYVAPLFGLTAAVNVRRPTEHHKPKRGRKGRKPVPGRHIDRDTRTPRDLDPTVQDGRFSR